MTTSYAIRHTTSFAYTSRVSESVMELRMRPANTDGQRCLQFEVEVHPRARVFAYQDFLGNWVHHFDIPQGHDHLTIMARAQVQRDEMPALPAALSDAAWEAVDAATERGEDWHFSQPSHFAAWTDPLLDFAASLGPAGRRVRDPLTTVREVMAAIHAGFEYVPKSTRVDSPIDEALAARRGVCQDFAHIMIALLRRVGLPCRYVSGYIAPRATGGDSEPSTVATHAWVEVRLPDLGWVGMDPTHNIEAGSRHLRVAAGRDYADVPPTRGTFKGVTKSALSVAVEVRPGEELPTHDPSIVAPPRVIETGAARDAALERARHQQQQQQQ